ncbi:MAG: hypothetical protein QOE58_2054 [Actinomycetota bacterium]|jgi:hypothetical protein|nr:hypothetical protein [Actinomycetota bacterium]
MSSTRADRSMCVRSFQGSARLSAVKAPKWFLVTFVAPNGWKYVMTCQASSFVEAVSLADDRLEYVERLGIKDYLQSDGLSAAPPARLTVEGVDLHDAGPGFGLVITDPQGNVTRK